MVPGFSARRPLGLDECLADTGEERSDSSIPFLLIQGKNLGPIRVTPRPCLAHMRLHYDSLVRHDELMLLVLGKSVDNTIDRAMNLRSTSSFRPIALGRLPSVCHKGPGLGAARLYHCPLPL